MSCGPERLHSMRTNAARSKGKILVTGSSGLVGTALRPVLVAMGFDIVGLDLRGDGADTGQHAPKMTLRGRCMDVSG